MDYFQQRNAKRIYFLEVDSGCCVGNGIEKSKRGSAGWQESVRVKQDRNLAWHGESGGEKGGSIQSFLDAVSIRPADKVTLEHSSAPANFYYVTKSLTIWLTPLFEILLECSPHLALPYR